MKKTTTNNNNIELLMEMLAKIISIPSVKENPEPGAPFGIETVNALNYLLSKGNDFGFQCKNLDGYAGYIDFGQGKKQVVALAHLDIVPPGSGWSYDPYVLTNIDGKLTGRGILDDKGPALAVLMAMKELKDEGYVPKNKIRLILGLDEESGCGCMNHYKSVEAIPDIGFTPDAKFPVIYAEKGILHLEITSDKSKPLFTDNLEIEVTGGDKANMVPSVCTYKINVAEMKDETKNTDKNSEFSIKKEVKGLSAHASLPQYGDNAISKAMEEISLRLKEKNISHPYVDFYTSKIGNTTDGSLMGINFSDKESGELTFNSGLIAIKNGNFSLTIDIRYPVTCTKEEIIEKITQEAGKYSLSVNEISYMEPLYRDPESDFVQSLLGVYNQVTGENRKPIAIGGGTYARRIPNVIAFGPVFDPSHDVAHQADEYILEKDLFLCIKIYKEALKKMDSLI